MPFPFDVSHILYVRHFPSFRRVHARFIPELGGIQFGVGAAVFEEGGVGAAFDDLAAVDDEDLVGGEDGGEAVSDGEGGATGGEPSEGVLDEAFGAGVEGGRGFVEDQDAWVFEDGAGDGDALLFAAGEFIAAFADDGVVAVRESTAMWSWMAAAFEASMSCSSVASGRP